MIERDCEHCRHYILYKNHFGQMIRACESWECCEERREDEEMRLIDADNIKRDIDLSFKSEPTIEAYTKEEVITMLDKIRAEIVEYGSIIVAYAITKDTKTDKGIEKLVSDVLKQAKEQVLQIIDKYKAESEDKE